MSSFINWSSNKTFNKLTYENVNFWLLEIAVNFELTSNCDVLIDYKYTHKYLNNALMKKDLNSFWRNEQLRMMGKTDTHMDIVNT